jgi:hypothetical protein
MRTTLGLVAAISVLTVGASAAGAAERYAEPNGNGPPSSCPRSDPCDIFDAVEDTSVQDDDEVIVLPGMYELGAAQLDVDDGINLHGALGEPRPLITSRSSFPTLDLSGFSPLHIHDLRLENSADGVAVSAISTPVAEIERIVAISTDSACHPPRAPGFLRDSVCFSTGDGGAAIQRDISGIATHRYDLRNVTAIATGAGADGISFETDGLTITVDARNTIVRGGTGIGAFDVSAAETGTGSITVALARSNYASRATGGNSTITDPATNSNQTAPPELADPESGDFHQLPGSPTINAGASVPLLGSLDFERQPRVQGSAPDIGADEFDRRLKLKAEGKKNQKAKRLKVRVRCPQEECYVTARGRVKASGERFKLKKTKRRFLEAGERKKLRLKAKHLDALKQLLAGGDGEAKIKVKGTDAGGVKAKKKLKVKLVG